MGLLACCLAIGALTAGCQPASTTTPDASSDTTESPLEVEEPSISIPTESSADATSAIESSTGESAPAAVDESLSRAVTLGDPSLTAGIPGSGALTVEQIKGWLARGDVHQVLEISLPMGLAAGELQIKGIEENPMTRAKIELGRQLYFDKRLSADSTVSCADCHHPDEGYARLTQFGVGIGEQTGNRNSPVSYNRILSDAQFWDGRAASLEEQAVGPIANPIEMGNTHDACVACLGGIEGYRLQFEAVFPDPDGITIENVGKAIAAFERAIVTAPAPYDYYEIVRSVDERFEPEEIEELKEEDPELYARYREAVQKAAPMSESARRGRELFFNAKGGCTECHVGANFTDEKYHNLGVGMDAEDPDLGRFVVTNDEKDKGAFKTPTVRNIIHSGPYMHDGSQKTLEEVVEWYAKGGHPNPHLSEKIKKLDLTEQDKQDLVAFMKEGLTSDFPTVEQGRLPE
ncbi:MAG: c-type cytochrome [Planctomycetales bacterium]|nr:c-type cytochrome [Planctomycetales bacterium]